MGENLIIADRPVSLLMIFSDVIPTFLVLEIAAPIMEKYTMLRFNGLAFNCKVITSVGNMGSQCLQQLHNRIETIHQFLGTVLFRQI